MKASPLRKSKYMIWLLFHVVQSIQPKLMYHISKYSKNNNLSIKILQKKLTFLNQNLVLKDFNTIFQKLQWSIVVCHWLENSNGVSRSNTSIT